MKNQYRKMFLGGLSMKAQYGAKKGEQVFYATKNKGKIKNVEKKSRKKKRS